MRRCGRFVWERARKGESIFAAYSCCNRLFFEGHTTINCLKRERMSRWLLKNWMNEKPRWKWNETLHWVKWAFSILLHEKIYKASFIRDSSSALRAPSMRLYNNNNNNTNNSGKNNNNKFNKEPNDIWFHLTFHLTALSQYAHTQWLK